MPTTVIMKTSRPDGAGGTYKQGSTYTLADDLAAYFLSIGAAKRTSTRSEQTGTQITGDSAGRFPSAPAQDAEETLKVRRNSDQGVDLYAFARAMRSSVIVGTAPADVMGSAVTTVQKLWSAKINAGAMKLGDTLRIMLGLLKSGTVDTATFTIRAGATDSAADAEIMSITTMTTSSLTYGALHHFKAVSSSALRRGGVNSSTNSLPGASGNAPASPVTVGDFSASDIYVGIYCTMTTGSEFPTVRNAILELIPGV